MATIKEQIELLEEEIHGTKYNKATQHHIGKLKAKVARLKEKLEAAGGRGGGGEGYMVRKTGNASVALVGFPSVGKSTLLNKITDAESEVGEYNFTTLDVIPGMMAYKGADIQVLDLPGIIKGAAKGKGKGKRVIAAARASDLIVLFIDVFYNKLEVLLHELFQSKIRVNEEPADINITMEEFGGINVAFTCEQEFMDEELVVDMIRSYGWVNASVVVRSVIKPYQLIDALTSGVVYLPSFLVINKADMAEKEKLERLKTKYKNFHPITTSLVHNQGLDILKERIHKKLRLIRIYMKPQGRKADMDEPLVIRMGSDVEAVCNTIHRDFVERFRYARVWGKSAKFPGQKVGLDHILKDGDVLSIIILKI